MKMPFATPVRVSDGRFLVAADAELICRAESATNRELRAIVVACNAHEALVSALTLTEARMLLDDWHIKPPALDSVVHHARHEAYSAVRAALNLAKGE